jgi:ElaB/YqjD/DUF883 family membrane-anchored ribosome-binding protein
MKTESPVSKKAPKEILQELHTIVADAESLLGARLSEFAQENGAVLKKRFAAAQKRLAGLHADVSGKIRAGAKRTDQAVRSHPYEAVALALGVGTLFGVLLRRKKIKTNPRRLREP